MIRNNWKKNTALFFIILIICLLGIQIIYNKISKKNVINQIQLSEIQYKSDNTIKKIDNIEFVIKYNTIYVPMDEIMKIIFGDEYKSGENLKLIWKEEQEYDIDEKDDIIVNKLIKDNVDYSTKVEIETLNQKKYIPIYLITSLKGINLKLDNKLVYNSENYINGIDAIKNNNKHTLEIINNDDFSESKYTYIGENDGALWREEALKNIEKYRKQETKINVINQNNEKIKEAEITLKLKSNLFKFGTALRFNDSKHDYYYDKINNQFFNTVCAENTFKWSWIQENNYVQAKQLNKFVNDNNFFYRGHNLWWDYVYSDELKNEIVGDENNPKENTMMYVYNKYKNGEINETEAKKLSQKIQENFEQIVLTHIKNEVSAMDMVQEWDVVNEMFENRYFQYYLYERNYLKDSNFISCKKVYMTDGNVNEEYLKFIGKCYNTINEINPKLILVHNENRIRSNSNNIIDLLNNLKKYTKNIGIIGVQSHISNKYTYTPQALSNKVDEISEKTNFDNFAITEYDNYINEKINKYTTQEKKDSANFLRDMLIMCYSNKKFSEFDFWVYNANTTTEEERKSYGKTVSDWLSFNKKTVANDGTICENLVEGRYYAKVTLKNGKTQEIEFNTNKSNENNVINIKFNSEITSIEMDEKKQTLYVKGDEFNYTDGKLIINYDDGTSKKIKLNENDVIVEGFDSLKTGNENITIKYQGHQVKYEIKVLENIQNKIKNIKEKNDNILKLNDLANNKDVLIKNNEIEKKIEDYDNFNTDIMKVNEIYDLQVSLLENVISESLGENIKDVIYKYLQNLNDYETIYNNFENSTNIEESEVKERINNLIDKYNSNTDIDLTMETDLINLLKDYYYNKVSGKNDTTSYFYKYQINSIYPLVNKLLDYDISSVASFEAKNISASFSSTEPTNKDVTVTINLPNNSYIKGYQDGKIVYTENAKKQITVVIRGYEFTYEIAVTNIDKEAPTISNITDGVAYLNEASPKVSDTNLSDVKLYYEGQVVNNYYNGAKLTDIGSYIIIATDKAGNESRVNFSIYEVISEKYDISGNYIKNITKKTQGTQVANNINVKSEYELIRNNSKINSSDKVATGDILKVGSSTFTLIVTGDITKTSDVNVKDLVKLRKYLIDTEKLTEIEKLAADVNEDTKINVKDLVGIRKLILK